MDIVNGKKSIWEFFISHYRFTFLIAIAFVLLGAFSLITIPKESNPEVDVPFAVVLTAFPGAAAQDVEELVTDILEDKILSLDEIATVTSTSLEGMSRIAVEFTASSDSDKKIDELKEKVDEAKIELPSGAEDPIVQKVRISDQSILTFALSGPFALVQLKKFAESLQDEIERISGVSRVEIAGGQKREVQVIIDKERLDSFRIPISSVTSAIQKANTDIPTGVIESADVTYVLRLAGRLQNAREVAKVPIGIQGGILVFVEDVAEVIDGYEERTSISRLSVDGNSPLPSIILSVFKVGGGNIVSLGEQVEEKIADAKKDFLPENVEARITLNSAEFVRDDLSTLARSGMQSVLLLMLVLLLFLGWREALLTAMAIPLTFLITFFFLLAIGSTLNFLSVFALILSLGILIDSSIVIVESMHEHISKHGRTAKEAAILTLRDFQTPLLAGTLTTLFAFAPMLLMSGILGEFIKHIPITIIIVLLSSLFVAFAIVPVIGMKWLRPPRALMLSAAVNIERAATNLSESRFSRFGRRGRIQRFREKYIKRIDLAERFGAKYEELLSSLLLSKKNKRIFTATLLLLFVLSLALPVVGILKVNMFPAQDFDIFIINISKPIGTPLEVTSQVVEPIEKLLAKDARVESFVLSIGTSAALGIDSAAPGTHFPNIVVNFQSINVKKQKSFDIVSEYRRTLTPLVDGDVLVTELGTGPPTGDPVLITITGDSLDILESLGKTFETMLTDIPGTRNVQTNIPESNGEFVLQIDRAKAQLYGVTTAEVAQFLQNAVQGTKATVIRREGKEMDVIVKYALDRAKVVDGRTNIVDLSTLESLTITTQVGNIPLSAFTRSEFRGGRPRIQHEAGERVVRVSSLVERGVTAREIFQEVEEQMQGVPIPAGYQVKMGGEAEDLAQSYNDMFRAMILAVFFIASALVLQFRSWRQPLFVLIIIPLALIGVFPGLVLTGLPLSFPGIIGIVALVGIVVNDAIILVDKINKNRRAAMPIFEAVKKGGVARLQPIILTTITTAVGIIPITLSAELWRSLGTSIIFGLLFSTVLTLFVVPMLYLSFAERQLDEVN